jgi:hypothetical protein
MITAIIPPVNMGISAAVKVILMHLSALKYRRILYSIFQEKVYRVVQTLPTYAVSDLHNFKNSAKFENSNIFELCARFFHMGLKAQ